VGSSPDNDGADQYCQMIWCPASKSERRNESEPVVEPAQVWNQLQPGRCGLGSSACCPFLHEGRYSDVGYRCRLRGHDECLRRSRGEAAAAKLDADPVDRNTVNMGTIPGPSHPSCCQHGDGQVHRRLMTPGWGGGSVVVRGRESRLHGEGTQRVRSGSTGMPGGRR